MMPLIRTVIFAFIVVLGVYFILPRDIPQSTPITLDEAISDIAQALHNIEAKYPVKDRIGLIVDEVNVQLNVQATQGRSGGAQLNLSNAPVSLVDGVVGATFKVDHSSNSSHGNTITIKFKHLATTDMSKGPYARVSKSVTGGESGKATASSNTGSMGGDDTSTTPSKEIEASISRPLVEEIGPIPFVNPTILPSREY